MSFLRWIVLVLLLAMGSEARAEAVVLIHGYFSGEDVWARSGVVGELESAGWSYGGSVTATLRGIDFKSSSVGNAKRAVYLADLPSEAPLLVQAQQLKEVVLAIKKRRGAERMVLIGHSAGGVVARLFMVREPNMAMQGVITIASPHLGTDKAEVVGLLASTPFSMVAPMMGADTLNRSKSLYDDLVRERPGSFLYWLNRQPHPKSRYISVVRKDSFALFGDNLVPVWSQDMAKVEALQGMPLSSLTLGTNHAMERQDGVELVRILNAIND
ncbi:MAG: alpha/beta fold hydrolase [Magnetococcales bacterium]|nr:alpha/beta fold hydrolase [Magnetococcales bacterium]